MRANLRNRQSAQDYDRYSAGGLRPWDEILVERAVEICGSSAPGFAVDVGTGTGIILILMARHPAFAAYRFIGCEYFADMAEQARTRVRAEGLTEKITILCADAHALPFANASVDLVISRATIHHLADPCRALKEKMRVLRPGGTALIHDARRDAPFDVLAKFNAMRAAAGYQPTTLGEKYTLEQMIEILRDADLLHFASVSAPADGMASLGFEVLLQRPS
jgi:ubiquinone/menaquinone biosynthesis C-methylase UbiE